MAGPITPDATKTAHVEVIDPATGATFGSVAGVSFAAGQAGDGFTITLKADPVVRGLFARLGGRAVRVTDAAGNHWLATAAPAAEGDVFSFPVVRKERGR